MSVPMQFDRNYIPPRDLRNAGTFLRVQAWSSLTQEEFHQDFGHWQDATARGAFHSLQGDVGRKWSAIQYARWKRTPDGTSVSQVLSSVRSN